MDKLVSQRKGVVHLGGVQWKKCNTIYLVQLIAIKKASSFALIHPVTSKILTVMSLICVFHEGSPSSNLELQPEFRGRSRVTGRIKKQLRGDIEAWTCV